jgi:hypothetical protein
MYQASVPVFTRMLTNLSAILKKAEDDATARKIDPGVFLTARLAPDMLTLTKQIQIASDAAKGCLARLAGIETPSFPDTETSFAELQDRIKKTIDFAATVTASHLDGTEEKIITLKLPSGEINMPGQAFLLNFATPNFYFHVTTAYAILRHNGVQIGKMDYLGGV